MAKKAAGPRYWHDVAGKRVFARSVSRKTLIQRSRGKGATEKATYHEIEGAGRGRVKREFFGVNDADERAIYALIEKGVDDAIKE